MPWNILYHDLYLYFKLDHFLSTRLLWICHFVSAYNLEAIFAQLAAPKFWHAIPSYFLCAIKSINFSTAICGHSRSLLSSTSSFSSFSVSYASFPSLSFSLSLLDYFSIDLSSFYLVPTFCSSSTSLPPLYCWFSTLVLLRLFIFHSIFFITCRFSLLYWHTFIGWCLLLLFDIRNLSSNNFIIRRIWYLIIFFRGVWKSLNCCWSSDRLLFFTHTYQKGKEINKNN